MRDRSMVLISEETAQSIYERFAAGDSSAREELILGFRPDAVRLASLHARGARTDLFDEYLSLAMEGVILGIESYQSGRGSMRVWVWIKAKNVIRFWKRSQKVRFRRFDPGRKCIEEFEHPASVTPDPSVIAIDRETAGRARRLIQERRCWLKHVRKGWDCLAMHFGLDDSYPMTYSEIAKIKGVDPDTVRKNVKRAIDILRWELNVA